MSARRCGTAIEGVREGCGSTICPRFEVAIIQKKKGIKDLGQQCFEKMEVRNIEKKEKRR